MAIFNSYVKLPEGTPIVYEFLGPLIGPTWCPFSVTATFTTQLVPSRYGLMRRIADEDIP